MVLPRECGESDGAAGSEVVMRIGNKVIMLLLAGGALALSAVTADARELTFQTPYQGDHVLNAKLFEPWFKALERESGGGLRIAFHRAGELVPPQNALPALMRGRIDMAGVNAQYQESLFPYTMAFTAPYLTHDSVQASALCQRALTTLPEVAAEWDKAGKTLFAWGSDRSGLFSMVGPILSPADLRGKRVLIWGLSQMDQVRSWGGIPVQVAPGDTLMALQRKLGDVFFGPLPTGVAYGLLDHAKDITVLPATTVFLAFVVNREVWDSLPDGQRTLLEKSAAGKSAEAGLLLYERTNQDMDAMRKAGCSVHVLDAAQFAAFKKANNTLLANWWISKLKNLGVRDAKGFLRLALDMANETPGAPDSLSYSGEAK